MKSIQKRCFLAAGGVTAVYLQVRTTGCSTVGQAVKNAYSPILRGISVRVTMSQTIHHGKKVVSFAAGTGRLISRLCKLPHDLGQLCIGLLILRQDRQYHPLITVSSQRHTPHYSKYSKTGKTSQVYQWNKSSHGESSKGCLPTNSPKSNPLLLTKKMQILTFKYPGLAVVSLLFEK